MIGLDANVIFQTIGMVIGGRHPGFYFLDEAETSDLVGTNTKPHYYIVGPSQISFFFFTFYQPLPKWVVIKFRRMVCKKVLVNDSQDFNDFRIGTFFLNF